MQGRPNLPQFIAATLGQMRQQVAKRLAVLTVELAELEAKGLETPSYSNTHSCALLHTQIGNLETDIFHLTTYQNNYPKLRFFLETHRIHYLFLDEIALINGLKHYCQDFEAVSAILLSLQCQQAIAGGKLTEFKERKGKKYIVFSNENEMKRAIEFFSHQSSDEEQVFRVARNPMTIEILSQTFIQLIQSLPINPGATQPSLSSSR